MNSYQTKQIVDGFNCPVCSNRDFILRHKVKSFEYYSCTNCEALHIQPFPTQEESVSWYQIENYYDNEDRNIGYDRYMSQKMGLQKTFKARNMLLGPPKFWGNKEVLEIGCGLGYYPEVICQIPNLSYLGIDLNLFAIKKLQSKGYQGFVGSIDDMPTHKQFDIIVMFDVLEHILTPNSFLRSVKEKLKPDGKILLTTPSTSSLLSVISGKKWVSYIVPQHVILYNIKSIEYVLMKNGFSIKKIKCDFQWVTLDFLTSRISDLIAPMKKIQWFFDYLSKALPLFLPVLNGNMVVTATSNECKD